MCLTSNINVKPEIGLEMRDHVGRHDGFVQGVRYFQCKGKQTRKLTKVMILKKNGLFYSQSRRFRPAQLRHSPWHQRGYSYQT